MARPNIKVYDIETKFLAHEIEGGWKNQAGLGLGSCVVYDYREDRYRFFMSDTSDQVYAMLEGSLVVSFNGIDFDNRIVTEDNNYKRVPWFDCDLFQLAIQSKFSVTNRDEAVEKLGFKTVHDGSLSLANIAKATLGTVGKITKGTEAPELIRSGNWGAVFEYNLEDVILTKRLFQYVWKHESLIDGKGNVIPIDLSSTREYLTGMKGEGPMD